MRKPKYLKNAMRIHWRDNYVPHCILDISRRCNISCRACYNDETSHFKTLEEIEQELKIILKARKVQSVLIVGGEPLLHPQMCEIVKMVKGYGLYAETCTNGLLLDDEMAKNLAQAGLNVCSLHIESLQKRPDLPYESTKEQRNDLRIEKAKLLAKYNIDPGIMITAFKDNPQELEECVELLLNSDILMYLGVTSYMDHENLGKMRGNITKQITSDNINYKKHENSYTMQEFADIVGKYFNNIPYNYISSTKNQKSSSWDARWLVYRTISACDEAGIENLPLKISLMERSFLPLFEFFNKHSMWYFWQTSCAVKIYAFTNSICGNFGNLGFLFKNRKKKFLNKTVLLTTEIEIEDGNVIRCSSCIDAQVKNGKLVPTCLVDVIEDVE